MKFNEQEEQENVVTWLRLKYPDVLFSGGFASCNLRPQQAMRRKRAGYKAGTPDIIFFEPRTGFHGMAIEMKKEKGGTVSPEQKEFLEKLSARGYCVHICRGAAEARRDIDEYFGG